MPYGMLWIPGFVRENGRAMKALRLVRLGHLELQDLPDPEVKDSDVLIRLRAAGICGTDLHIFRHGFPGVTLPVVLGHEFAGEIVEVGQAVTEFQVGERVTAENVVSCGQCRLCRSGRYEICPQAVGPGFSYDGAMAEYLAVPARTVHRVPDTLSWREAAAIEPAANALWAVERGRVNQGDHVAILGDGFIGLAMVRVARLMGAEVAMVGHHDFRLGLAAQLGASLCTNSAREDPITPILSWSGGEGCDVVIEAAGGARALRQALELVCPGGRVVMFGLPDKSQAVDLSKVVLSELELLGALGHPNRWQATISLMGRGQLDIAPLLTHAFTLEQGPEAFFKSESRADDCIKVQFEMS
jgi:2-desacetyl-2-hydroxyethyl bacteriochlorophyllide A dehydrogenase